METPENIEPQGWNENQKRNESSVNDEPKNEFSRADVDDTNSGMAANADGNELAEEVQNPDPADINGGKGFLGDFATIQHDDELEEKNRGAEDENHIMT